MEKVRPFLTKKTTTMRKPISVEEKLACTLRFLATGDNYPSLSYLFRIHRTTISLFVPVVCFYIFKVLKDEFCRLHESEAEWMKISDDSFACWNFPNGLAAINGKHIAITNATEGSSTYHNYKGFHSIVLMGIFSHDYQFVAHDVGCQGRISDGGVWANTKLC